MTDAEPTELDERRLRMRLMELEIERKLQEIRYENRKFTVQLISAVAAITGVALAFGIAVGWFAHSGPLGGL
jgi:hypothetical protein